MRRRVSVGLEPQTGVQSNKERGRKMKYIAFWEARPDDMDKVIEKYNLLKSDEGLHEKFPRCISKNFSLGGALKGFQLFETEDPEQLVNASLYYMPEVEMEFVPIVETERVIESYLKQ
jgi:hypothetical protein